MTDRLAELEQALFDKCAANSDAVAAPIVFILGSPRTGSTLLYQFIINMFDVFYVSNLINDAFPLYPAVGAVLDVQLNPREPVPYESRFGKSETGFGPSEGSLVFRHWYGGDHPSQTRSAVALPDRREHMVRSFAAMHAVAARPVVCKNAWNCFRVRDLATTFTACTFLWIRRDIESAATSDLFARCAHGSPERWNSATTTNYRDLQDRPYWEQVVEQQYEYNQAIDAGLSAHASGRHLEVWYEDLCDSPEDVIARCAQHFEDIGIPARRRQVPAPVLARSAGQRISEVDSERIRAYVAQHAEDRFASHCRDSHAVRRSAQT